MRAIRFEAFGDPSVLHVAEVPDPVADERTAVVRVMAASINPSDVKNVAGAMEQTTLPRIPGRDFAGVVEAGPADRQNLREVGSAVNRINSSDTPSRKAGTSRIPLRARFLKARALLPALALRHRLEHPSGRTGRAASAEKENQGGDDRSGTRQTGPASPGASSRKYRSTPKSATTRFAS
jgi:Alcohol dehydrogenase GroES-like domain